MLARIEIK